MLEAGKVVALLSPLRSRKQPLALAQLLQEPSFGQSWWNVAIDPVGVEGFSRSYKSSPDSVVELEFATV